MKLDTALVLTTVALVVAIPLAAQEKTGAPERLGAVQFASSCDAAVQPQLNRAVALLFTQLVALGQSGDPDRPELVQARAALGKK
jgi:hypothetical protein